MVFKGPLTPVSNRELNKFWQALSLRSIALYLEQISTRRLVPNLVVCITDIKSRLQNHFASRRSVLRRNQQRSERGVGMGSYPRLRARVATTRSCPKPVPMMRVSCVFYSSGCDIILVYCYTQRRGVEAIVHK